MSAATFDAFSAARALEAAGVEPRQAEAIASAIAAQTVTRADLEPLATKADLASLRAELGTVRWVVGIQSAITVATFAIVAAKPL